MIKDYVLGFSLFNGIRFLKDGQMYDTTNISKKNRSGVTGYIAQLIPNGKMSFAESSMDGTLLPELIYYNLNTREKIQIYMAENITHESFIGSNIPRYYTPFFNYELANEEILYMTIIPNYDLNILNYFIFIKNKNNEVIWGWDASEHIDEFELTFKEYNNALNNNEMNKGGLFHFNSACKIGENIWYDQGDSRFHPDNIIVTSRNLSCIFIIDYNTKKIVWKIFGERENLFKFPHYGHIIPKGLEGNGNLLFVNNRETSTTSSIIELNPITKEIVFKWDGFFTPNMGSVQKLLNNNYLVGESKTGTVFEVSPKGKVIDKFVDINKQFYRVNAYPKQWFKEDWFQKQEKNND